MNKAAKIFTLMGVVLFVAGAAASVAPSLAYAQTIPTTCPNFGLERTTVYDLQDEAYAYGYGVAADGTQNTYAVGEQYSPATGLDAFVIKYDQNGSVAWRDVYDAVASGVSGNESAYGVAVAADGSVYVAGRKQDSLSLNSDIFVRKYTNAGTLQWTQTYDYGNADIARAAAVDGAGNVYAAGYRQNADGNVDMVVLSYDPSGNMRGGFPVWYGGANNESAYGIALSGSDIYVTGYEQPAANNTDMFLRKYTTAGALAWAQTYNSTGNQSDIGYGVGIDGVGNVFVTGYHDTKGGDSFLRKYSATGSLLWAESYNSGGDQNDVGRGVVAGNSGRIFFAGRQQTNNEDAFLNEYYTEKNVPILPASNPPPGTEDWTSTQNVHCEDNGNAPEGWEPGYTLTRTACDTGFHTYMNLPIESCTATSSGTHCWYAGWSSSLTCEPYTTTTTCYATLIESGFFTAVTSPALIYRGEQGGAPEYSEMAYGIAATPSGIPAYATTANDVYVVGYEADNGGAMFLNKYSCSAASSPTFGASTLANFYVTPQTGTAPLTVKADARATAGNIVRYEWDWNYNGTSFVPSGDRDAVVTHTYASDGSFVVALRVTDTKSVTDIATVPVTVSPNTAPIAAFETCDLNNAGCIASTSGISFDGVLPLRVNVNGAPSSDPDPSGSIVSFSWNWGDGTVRGSGEKTTHTYSAEGTYTITLTVTDNGGLTNTVAATQDITVTTQYVCAPACSGTTPVCGPGLTAGATQCYACLADNDCGTGYQCLGVSCTQGTQCSDGTMCPLDGKCPESVSCNPLATGATCPDGSACPANGVCPAIKYSCALSSSAVDAQCYVEEFGGCLIDSDCRAGITGGVCIGSPGVCRYAKCLNTTDFACTNDNDCVNGDGTCNAGVCNYVYDCAYGPGMGGGASGLYATTTADAMPKMPQGVQPDGQACTKPTPDAPNNCEGINGCLYYNYNSNGTPITNSNNSVANCINTFEGGTGCLYYQAYDGVTQTEKTNCLPRYAENIKKSPQAGIPDGCFVMDKGKAGKEYDCSAVDGCYYYLDGRVDCRYVNVTDEACATSATCTTQSLATGACNASGLCEYRGSGCIYEPNPKGAISCPGASKAATGGDNFVQCLLNKDAGLPGFLLGAGGAGLSACVTNADCPFGDICVDGTCYPQCQANVDCATGEQCTTTCSTSLDCSGSLVCSGGICIPPTPCTSGTICPTGVLCPLSGICPVVPACTGAIPTGTLPSGTTSTNIGLTTNQSAICAWSLVSTDPYSAMTAFGSVADTLHSTLVSGLFSGTNTYFVRCQESITGTVTDMCQIAFDVGTPCTSSAMCPTGYMCVAGMCQPPVCSGATPTGALASGTTTATVGMTTDVDSYCRYSTNSAEVYASMTSFSTTGGTNHSASVFGLVTGNNTQYVRCQDVSTSAEKFCQIPFSVGVCSSEFKCDTGLMCIPNTGTGMCSTILSCTPGTLCPTGVVCPVDGICPLPPACIGPGCTALCPWGTSYYAVTGTCESCTTMSTLPGCEGWKTWCDENPTSPPCVSSGCTGPGCGILLTGATSCNTLGYTFTNTAVTASGNCDLVAIILALLSWIAWIIALLAVLSGLRAGYLYITAMGNEQNLILAKRYLIYTTIGVGVSVLTFSIVAITRAILNI